MPECCGRFFSANGIRNHLDNSSVHAYEIECGWCYARWPAYAGKLRLKHEQEKHWLSCDECTYIFRSEGDLKTHKADEHPEPPPNYCYGCKRRFQNLNNLNQHLKSSIHAGKNAKCPWCPNMFTNLTGVCLHLESGACVSGINRQQIDQYCRQVDRNHIFTNKQIGWHDDGGSVATTIATAASWDGYYYVCCLCKRDFTTLQGLNQHLGSPVHRQKIYHCPRCRREYVALSGLINHVESESCGPSLFRGGHAAGLGFVKQLRITH